MTITIPADEEGYVLHKCPICGEYFKLSADDINLDKYREIYCPACGLTSDSYVIEEVIQLAEKMLANFAQEQIYRAFKDLERSSSKILKLKAGPKPKKITENPIQVGVQNLEETNFECCHIQAKISPALKQTMAYCPHCGEANYELE